MNKELQKEGLDLLVKIHESNELANKAIVEFLKKVAEQKKDEEKDKKKDKKKDNTGQSKSGTSEDSPADMIKNAMEALKAMGIRASTPMATTYAQALQEAEKIEQEEKIKEHIITAGEKLKMIDDARKSVIGAGLAGGMSALGGGGIASESTELSEVASTSGKVYCGVCKRHHTRGTHD